MHFEYSLTIADLNEARKPVLTPRQQARLRRGFIGWVVLVSLGAGIIFLTRLTVVPGRRLPVLTSSAFEYPAQNLWVTLAPSLLPVSMMVLLMILGNFSNWRRIRIARKTNSPPPERAPGNLLGLITIVPMVVCVLLPVIPAASLQWNPSPSLALWAAYAPWIFFSVFIIAITRLNRRLSAALAWYKTGSLRRQIQLDVTTDGIDSDNGLQKCFWKWAGFERYRETENLIILTTEDQSLMIIPKRTASEPAALDALYAVIQNSVPKGEFRPRESRFPVLPRAVVPITSP